MTDKRGTPTEEKTFVPITDKEERVHITVAKDSDKRRHIFGDEWMYRVGGRRRGRSSKKDRADSKEQRMWEW